MTLRILLTEFVLEVSGLYTQADLNAMTGNQLWNTAVELGFECDS